MIRIDAPQLPLDVDDADSVRQAMQAGKAERRRKGRRARGEKLTPNDLFALQITHDGLPVPVREGLFASHWGRRWKLDFCWREYGLAIEIEGLVVRKLAGQLVCMGRHASITGFREDCEKYAHAALLGITVVRFEQSQVRDRYAATMAARLLQARGWNGVVKPMP
jgi:hypothetical protein